MWWTQNSKRLKAEVERLLDELEQCHFSHILFSKKITGSAQILGRGKESSWWQGQQSNIAKNHVHGEVGRGAELLWPALLIINQIELLSHELCKCLDQSCTHLLTLFMLPLAMQKLSVLNVINPESFPLWLLVFLPYFRKFSSNKDCQNL